MNVSTPNCPVPPDQLPLNEYQSLKESWFFHWSTFVTGRYLQRLLVVGSVAWLFCLPFAREAFFTEESWLKWAIAAALGAIVFLTLVAVRLYLGWHYISHRLDQPVVEYEETGWYDGQRWPKTGPQLDRDRLVRQYEVRPVMTRLKYTLAALLGSGVLCCMAWSFVSA